MQGNLKISVNRIPISRNGFIDWLPGYVVVVDIILNNMRICTDNMAEPIFVDNFAVFVLKQHFLYFI